MALITGMLCTNAVAQPQYQWRTIPSTGLNGSGYPQSGTTPIYPFVDRGASFMHTVYTAAELGNDRFDLHEIQFAIAGNTTTSGYIANQTVHIWARFVASASPSSPPFTPITTNNYSLSNMATAGFTHVYTGSTPYGTGNFLANSWWRFPIANPIRRNNITDVLQVVLIKTQPDNW